MEAAGVPRLDVERFRLIRRSTRGTGQRGPSRRDKSGVNGSRLCRCGGRGTKRAPLYFTGAWIYPTARSGRWRIELFIRPVLKHGPRSLTCMRAGGRQTH